MKKSYKLLSCLMIAMLILAAMPAGAFADTSMTWFDFHYRYINNGTEIEITGYWGTDRDITVPRRIYDVPVTEVNLMAILHPEAIRSVGIPASVTDIKAGSLKNCPNLSTLSFWGDAPHVWGSQNGQPFSNNAPDFKIYYLPGKTGFTNPWYGHTPQEAPAPLVDHAYYKSAGYTYQIRPGDSALIVKYNNGSYQPDVVIPAQLEGYPVTKIGPNAFKDVNINSVTIPEGVKTIGQYAFQYCALKDVNIPHSVTRIEEGAFYHSGLTRVSLPRQLTYIGNDAFRDCDNLHLAKFFGAPQSVGSLVFDSCASDFLIYYLPGVTGFTNPWHGYSTAELPTVPTEGNQPQTPAITLQAQANITDISLSWNSITDPRGISGYKIYKGTSTQELFSQTEEEAYVTDTIYTDRLVEKDITYYYCVKAVYGDSSDGAASNVVSATPRLDTGTQGGTIQLTIDNPIMTSNGLHKEIDSGFGTAPLIKDGAAYLPIRSVITEIGGNIQWDGAEKKIIIDYNGIRVELWIGQTKARVNGTETIMKAAPFISDTGRTMLPLRFVGESLGCDISWDNTTKTATITYDPTAVKTPSGTDTPVPPASTKIGVPSGIPAPTISNLQQLKDESGVPYFRLEVTIPDALRTLNQIRPAEGWVDMESLKIVDDEEEIPDGGGLEVFMQEPVPGKSGAYYVTFEVIDEGGLTEISINERNYSFKVRFSYTYIAGGEYQYVYSPWSNELSAQSESYYRSDEE